MQDQNNLILDKLKGHDKRFEKMDRRFELIDRRFTDIDKKFEQAANTGWLRRIDEKVENREKRISKLEQSVFN